jgi:hypothetical protein
LSFHDQAVKKSAKRSTAAKKGAATRAKKSAKRKT